MSKGGQTINRLGTISVRDVASSLDKLADEYDTGTNWAQVNKVKKAKESFLKQWPKYIDKSDAVVIKRRLDNIVGKDYQKLNDAKEALSVEVNMTLANAMRKELYRLDPELGNLAAGESLLINVRSGLLPKVAEKGTSLDLPYVHKYPSAFAGTAAGNVLGGALTKTMGTPARYLTPLTRYGTRGIAANRDDMEYTPIQP